MRRGGEKPYNEHYAGVCDVQQGDKLEPVGTIHKNCMRIELGYIIHKSE